MKKLVTIAFTLILSCSPAYALDSFSVIVATEDGKTALQYATVALIPLFQISTKTKPVVHDLAQKDEEFNPLVITISTGDSVSFPNYDDFNHHVYSFSKTKPFELPFYKKGDPQPAPVRIDNEGLVVVGCNIHDSMRAYILSVNTPFHTVTGKNGLATFKNLPRGKYRLEIWHPKLPAGSKPKAFSVDSKVEYKKPPVIKLKAKPIINF